MYIFVSDFRYYMKNNYNFGLESEYKCKKPMILPQNKAID